MIHTHEGSAHQVNQLNKNMLRFFLCTLFIQGLTPNHESFVFGYSERSEDIYFEEAGAQEGINDP